MQDVSAKNKILLINAVGEVIKSHRKAKGKTMYKISAEVSMSKSTWREAEVGACKDINLSTLWKISEGLEIPPAKLIEEVSQKLGKDFTLTGLD